MNVDAMQFGFMSGRRTKGVMFVVRKIHEEYIDKERNLCLCFVVTEKLLTELQER